MENRDSIVATGNAPVEDGVPPDGDSVAFIQTRIGLMSGYAAPVRQAAWRPLLRANGAGYARLSAHTSQRRSTRARRATGATATSFPEPARLRQAAGERRFENCRIFQGEHCTLRDVPRASRAALSFAASRPRRRRLGRRTLEPHVSRGNSSRLADAPQRLGGVDDGNTLVLPERLQVVIARDDHLCTGGARASKHRSVVGIAKPRLVDGCGVDDPPAARSWLRVKDLLQSWTPTSLVLFLLISLAPVSMSR